VCVQSPREAFPHSAFPRRDKKKKKKKSKKGKKSKKRDRDGGDEDIPLLVQKKGTGRIVTSGVCCRRFRACCVWLPDCALVDARLAVHVTTTGTTVHGKETKFMDELSIGDALMVSHPTRCDCAVFMGGVEGFH